MGTHDTVRPKDAPINKKEYTGSVRNERNGGVVHEKDSSFHDNSFEWRKKNFKFAEVVKVNDYDISDDQVYFIKKFLVLPCVLLYLASLIVFSVMFSLNFNVDTPDILAKGDDIFARHLDLFDVNCLDSNGLNYQSISNLCKELCSRFMKSNVPTLNDEKSWKKIAICKKVINTATIETSNNNMPSNETRKIGN